MLITYAVKQAFEAVKKLIKMWYAVCFTRTLLKVDLFPVMSMKIPLGYVQVIHCKSPPIFERGL